MHAMRVGDRFEHIVTGDPCPCRPQIVPVLSRTKEGERLPGPGEWRRVDMVTAHRPMRVDDPGAGEEWDAAVARLLGKPCPPARRLSGSPRLARATCPFTLGFDFPP